MVEHELNVDFEWQDHTGPYRILTDEQVSQYDRQGFFIYKDAFDAATIADLIAAIDPLEAQFEQEVREKYGGTAFIMRADEITFTAHLVTKSKTAREFTLNSFFRDICSDLLGPNVRLYWDQSVYKKPGTKDIFPWHQDNGYTYVKPQQYLTCWVALTDAGENNGCPVISPGIHRRGTLAHQMTRLGWDCIGDRDIPTIRAPVKAGSVVVFSSLTPHMTLPNTTTDEIRKSYIVQFAPDGAVVIGKKNGDNFSSLANDADRQYWILQDGATPL